MSKRFYPQQTGDRKKARLDVSISDHNFPLSQNPSSSKEVNTNNWGDDNDDEILLLASQACEQAYPINDISTLPDYSICMKPSSTSTQMFQEPAPSTSKSTFAFKKPSFNSPASVSTHLKDKCGTISSPLPGIATKMPMPSHFDDDDFIFNDNVFKAQDGDFVYRQLLQLKEENAKLKSENCKLSEKCVTKEGEVSILRTQLKSSHMAVDNARMERVKDQKRVQMEWNEKLTAANNQAHDLQTKLDFKNLEIISIKEKCKMLESSKVKLTQVNVAAQDSSNRHNSTYFSEMAHSTRKVKMASNSVQTERNSHFIKLNKTCRKDQINIDKYLPYIMKPSEISQNILCNNEKLHKNVDTSHNGCKDIATIYQDPATSFYQRNKRQNFSINSLYEDLTNIFGCKKTEEVTYHYFNVLDKINDILKDIENQLEFISQRMTTAFQREMDDKYMEHTNAFKVLNHEDLLSGMLIHKDEQGMLARRVIAIMDHMLEYNLELFLQYEQRKQDSCIDFLCKICTLLDSTASAVLYSGFLLSTTNIILELLKHKPFHTKLKLILKNMITSRPMYQVILKILHVLSKMALEVDLSDFCPKNNTGNLKTDYEQGVLLFKKDSCIVQILLKQIEAALKCIKNQRLGPQSIEVTQDLIAFYNNSCLNTVAVGEKARCDCRQSLSQVIVYALNICAADLKHNKTCNNGDEEDSEVLSVCRSGLKLLYQGVIRDVEFNASLSHNEGHFIEFAETMKEYRHGEIYGNMLTELTSTFQAGGEDTPPSYHRRAWMKSFRSLSLVD